MFFQSQGKVEISLTQFLQCTRNWRDFIRKSKINTHTDIQFFKSPWENFVKSQQKPKGKFLGKCYMGIKKKKKELHGFYFHPGVIL